MTVQRITLLNNILSKRYKYSDEAEIVSNVTNNDTDATGVIGEGNVSKTFNLVSCWVTWQIGI